MWNVRVLLSHSVRSFSLHLSGNLTKNLARFKLLWKCYCNHCIFCIPNEMVVAAVMRQRNNVTFAIMPVLWSEETWRHCNADVLAPGDASSLLSGRWQRGNLPRFVVVKRALSSFLFLVCLTWMRWQMRGEAGKLEAPGQAVDKHEERSKQLSSVFLLTCQGVSSFISVFRKPATASWLSLCQNKAWGEMGSLLGSLILWWSPNALQHMQVSSRAQNTRGGTWRRVAERGEMLRPGDAGPEAHWCGWRAWFGIGGSVLIQERFANDFVPVPSADVTAWEEEVEYCSILNTT